ncbi:PREDICTED: probable transcription repressor OFP9 [Tarenaya hassleriana]|uniref:probable transcription repressor OFP9 n=1 Tax=Tarenaya hassleriana TaxID=28532 RepID=UPI0008FD4464|nr:PREDICTED: probable transcription repressor OFP9 [Tarenaya hassleriana]
MSLQKPLAICCIKDMRRGQEEHSQSCNCNKKPTRRKRETRICRSLCCITNTRFSVSSSSSSSSSEEPSERFSDQHGSLSSLTHYMVQEKLDQMIRDQRQEATHQEKLRHRKMGRGRTRRRSEGSSTKFIVMMAMEKFSYDPREDFRDSMAEMIIENRINDAEELRSLLESYLSMNPREFRPVILDIFYEVCSDLFVSRL